LAWAQSEPSLGRVPFHITFANGLQLSRPVQVGFHLALRRPIETIRLIGQVKLLPSLLVIRPEGNNCQWSFP
jgi:hypothetical protein